MLLRVLQIALCWAGVACGAGALCAAAPATQPAIEKIPGTAVSFEMIRVPGGTMEVPGPGADAKPRQVNIKPFWIGKTEVTFDAYDVFLYKLDLNDQQKDALSLKEADLPKHAWSRPSLPYGNVDCGWGHADHPAIHIHHHAAQMFCRWLSEKTGKKYRLPTEAEWEYACSAGAEGSKPDVEALDKVAWYAANSQNQAGDCTTYPVGIKAANAWGLHDMLGNAAEWAIAADGQPVLKGGSYKSKARDVHWAARLPFDPDWQMTDPEDPRSSWWLRDGPHAGMRIVRED